MRRLALLALAGCGAMAGDPSEPGATEVVDPTHVTAIRIHGLDRFDRVSLMEGGNLCGTQAGHAPVCASDDRGAAWAQPYEALDDVIAMQALGTGRCVLFGGGNLTCDFFRTGLPKVSDPREWPLIQSGVVDFIISATTNEARVFALDNERQLSVTWLNGELRIPTPTVVARDVRSFGWRDGSGACAVLGNGDAVCSDKNDPGGPMKPTGFHGAAKIFNGGAVIYRFGAFAYVLDSWAAFVPWPKTARDYSFQQGCVIEANDSIECANVGPWLQVTLPAKPVRFAPGGYVSCAKLVDDTTACWGPFLAQVQKLAERPRRDDRQIAR